MMGIIGMMIHEGLVGNPIFPIAVRQRGFAELFGPEYRNVFHVIDCI